MHILFCHLKTHLAVWKNKFTPTTMLQNCFKFQSQSACFAFIMLLQSPATPRWAVSPNTVLDTHTTYWPRPNFLATVSQQLVVHGLLTWQRTQFGQNVWNTHKAKGVGVVVGIKLSFWDSEKQCAPEPEWYGRRQWKNLSVQPVSML
jgi:hypothetical protein